MEEDEQDGSHASYPEPTTTNSAPYPAILQSDSTGNLQTRLSNGDGSSSQQPLATQPTAGTGFSNRADYYKLGEKALFNLSRLARNSGEARRWNNDAGGSEDETRSTPRTPPSKTTPRATPSTPASGSFALPGFHFLPEADRLDSVSPQTQRNPRPDPASTQDASPPTRGQRRGPGRPRGSGRRGWRQVLRGTEHADLFKAPPMPREAGGRPRGRGRGSRGGRRVDPGQQYKTLQSQAMAAYLDNDLDVAKEHTLAALKVNPEVWASYSLLYEITQKQGLEQESIQVLASGAPVKRDPNLWVEVATRFLGLKGNDKTELELEFALKCYDEAVKLENHHFNARKARMEIFCELKLWHKARKECGTLLALQPTNLEILWRHAKLCDQAGIIDDIRGAIDLYEKAFQLCAEQPSFGPVDDQWDHLNLYLDMLGKVGPPAKGTYQLKRIARWFLGRQEDTFWNDVWQDDCEFDEEPERRMHVPQVQSGRISQDSARYGHGLPIELRVKLGLFRLQMGPSGYSEAFRHFEYLRRMTDPADIEHLMDLFMDVGNLLRVRGMYGAAVEYFDRLGPISTFLSREYWMNLAQCCREIGRNADAEAAYKKVIDTSEHEVQARINLIKLYESTAQNMKALPIADELIQIGRSETLKNNNMATYIKACKRVKRNAAKAANGQATQLEDDEESSSATDVDEGASHTSEQIIYDMPTKRPRKLRKLARKPATNKTNLRDPLNEAEDGGVNGVDETDKDEDAPLTSAPSNQGARFARGTDYLQSLREQRARVTTDYTKITELWAALEGDSNQTAVKQWIHHAASMAQEFKLMKEFYPTKTRDKLYVGLRTGVDAPARNLVGEMEATKKRLLEDAARLGQVDDTVPLTSSAQAQFHEISFAEWHRILSTLALLYAQETQQEDCYYILQKVLLPANVFRDDPELLNATHAVSLCCGLIFNDINFVVETSKRLAESCDDAVATQIVAAAGRLGHREVDFYSKKTQKWLSASVEEQDYLAMPSEDRDQHDWGKSTRNLAELAKTVDVGRTHLSPGMLTTYAHSVVHGNSSATLLYLYRALAMEPEDPVINLSIATTYITQATRKPVTRHHDIAQGMAFFYRYYDLRVATGKTSYLQEAEYNLARMWHLLKIVHQAVTGYEKVLELSGEVQQDNRHDIETETEDFSNEAAFALQRIYAAAGNEEAARSVTEKWLVL